MTEPTRVSYKGLEEPATFDVVQRLVVSAVIMSLFMPSGSVDAIPATASSVDHQNVLNDSTMPAEDKSDLSNMYKESNYSLTVEVEEEDDDDDVSCSANQYLDRSLNACKNCTTCGPGMQHEIDQSCGYGKGFEQICEPCADGYYQDRTSSHLVRCKRCVTCDQNADTLQECSKVHDAQCGSCPPGMYYFQTNLCIDCEDGDSDKEECIATILSIQEPTQSTPPFPITTHASPATTVGVVILTTSANIGNPAKGTESPPTEQTKHGVEKRTGVWVAVTVGLGAVILPLVVLGAFKLVKRLRKRDKASDKDVEEGAENESMCGNHGLNSGQVWYRVEDETIGYNPVSQVEPLRDEMDQPQPLRSDLPFGQSPLGQDAPPASLPREHDAVPL